MQKATNSEHTHTSIGIDAPAKVNLFLHITGRRSDGYHELESLVVFVDVADRLTLSVSNEFGLDVIGPFASAIDGLADDNLVLRSAKLVSQYATQPIAPVHFKLVKNIPVAAGVGGGSSDAAAAVRALQEIWDLTLTDEVRSSILLQLGADTPVCHFGATAFVSGIGEIVGAFEITPPIHIVMVNPNAPVPTGPVFRAYAKRGQEFLDPILEEVPGDELESLIGFLQRCENSLEGAAIENQPVVGRVLGAVSGTRDCLLVRMSGSGGTCFGLYATEGAASDAAKALKSEYSEWWVQPGRILKSRPCIERFVAAC
jgi:4-diphosphocytidyl-2-C-methyl-D-erythritol kinase